MAALQNRGKGGRADSGQITAGVRLLLRGSGWFQLPRSSELVSDCALFSWTRAPVTPTGQAHPCCPLPYIRQTRFSESPVLITQQENYRKGELGESDCATYFCETQKPQKGLVQTFKDKFNWRGSSDPGAASQGRSQSPGLDSQQDSPAA